MKKDNPLSPCCNKAMRHIPDNVHFHYECVRCGIEYDLDGKSEWHRPIYMTKKRKKRTKEADNGS